MHAGVLSVRSTNVSLRLRQASVREINLSTLSPNVVKLVERELGSEHIVCFSIAIEGVLTPVAQKQHCRDDLWLFKLDNSAICFACVNCKQMTPIV